MGLAAHTTAAVAAVERAFASATASRPSARAFVEASVGIVVARPVARGAFVVKRSHRIRFIYPPKLWLS